VGIRRRGGGVGWFPNQEPQRTPDQFWRLFFRGGNLPPGSWFGIHPKNFPRGGWFGSRDESRVSYDQIGGDTEDRRFSFFEAFQKNPAFLLIALGAFERPHYAGSRINFRTTFPDSTFLNEFLWTRFQVLLYLISNWHYFVSGFISPRIRTFVEKRVSRSLFQKEGFEIWGCSFVSELKLRSTSSAEENFADEITWIT